MLGTATKGPTRLKGRNPAVPLSKNEHLLRWVEKMAELAKPAAIHWVDGSQEENDLLLRADGRSRNVHQAERETLARLLLRAIGRERCCPRGRPHVHLFAFQRQRRPDQQLGKSVRDAQEAEESFQRLRCAAARCTCCRSAWARSARRCRRSACN